MGGGNGPPPPAGNESSQIAVLQELARLANRNIETQVAFLEAINEKSQQTLSFGMTVLAAASAILQFFIEKVARPEAFGLLTLVLGAWVIGGLGLFYAVTGYLGSRSFRLSFQVSWDFDKLAEVAASSEHSLEDVLRANITGAKGWFLRNRAVIEEARRRRMAGLHYMAGSAILLALAYLLAAASLAG